MCWFFKESSPSDMIIFSSPEHPSMKSRTEYQGDLPGRLRSNVWFLSTRSRGSAFTWSHDSSALVWLVKSAVWLVLTLPLGHDETFSAFWTSVTRELGLLKQAIFNWRNQMDSWRSVKFWSDNRIISSWTILFQWEHWEYGYRRLWRRRNFLCWYS